MEEYPSRQLLESALVDTPKIFVVTPLITTKNDSEGVSSGISFLQPNTVNVGILCCSRYTHIHINTTSKSFTYPGFNNFLMKQINKKGDDVVGYDFLFDYEKRFDGILNNKLKFKMQNRDTLIDSEMIIYPKNSIVPILPSLLRVSKISFEQMYVNQSGNEHKLGDNVFNEFMENPVIDENLMTRLLNAIPKDIWSNEDNNYIIGLMIKNFCKTTSLISVDKALLIWKQYTTINSKFSNQTINELMNKITCETIDELSLEDYVNSHYKDNIVNENNIPNHIKFLNYVKFNIVDHSIKKHLITGSDFYKIYINWCDDNNIDSESNCKFGLIIKPYVKKYVSHVVKYNLSSIN